MKVRLKRTGGLAGMTQQWEINLQTISSDKAAEFKKLLEAAALLSLPEQAAAQSSGASQCRDFFCYEFTLEEKNQKKTLQFSEDQLSKPLRDCVEWMTGKL